MSKNENESVSSRELAEKYNSDYVKILGDFKLDCFKRSTSLTVYRYMRYKWAKNLIESKKISFADPATWEDPFEKRFVCGDYEQSGFKKNQVAAFCVTTEHGENESAFWRQFDMENRHDLVQLTFDFDVLIKSLSDFAQKNNAKVYVSPCKYDYTSEEIKNNSKIQKVYKTIDEESFIELACLKRRAFKYEYELRIFMYGEKLPIEGGRLNIPLKGKLVKTLKVCPNPSVEAFVSNDFVREMLQERLGIRVEKSHLYDEVSKFKFSRGK
ncbi:hypothetical protein [Fibrobacter intestinalis]|uniref:DUF2971 domain-containing protein n=1 Tax=Fibrobacter intestinalis TaxID=28122 RepID=A0A1T4KV74_9BACT|nr:hypothetical protein [Fibrobacter intestinalis]PBC72700.1 hypothetical protein BGW94_0277 [Fibrobacter sp. NR9]SJZ46270.1 hypothetical protein SAMN02745108_00656 [Fibrobacter intestinalis]